MGLEYLPTFIIEIMPGKYYKSSSLMEPYDGFLSGYLWAKVEGRGFRNHVMGI